MRKAQGSAMRLDHCGFLGGGQVCGQPDRTGAKQAGKILTLGLVARQGGGGFLHPPGLFRIDACAAKGTSGGGVLGDDMAEKAKRGFQKAGKPAVTFAPDIGAAPIDKRHGDMAIGGLMQKGGAQLAFGKKDGIGLPVVEKGFGVGLAVCGRGLQGNARNAGGRRRARQQHRMTVIKGDAAGKFGHGAGGIGGGRVQPDQPPLWPRRARRGGLRLAF